MDEPNEGEDRERGDDATSADGIVVATRLSAGVCDMGPALSGGGGRAKESAALAPGMG
jgi:hypothetical protein